MEVMRLIRLSQFITEQYDLLINEKINFHQYISRTFNYSEFLKQHRKLEHFFLLTPEGNILKKPCKEKYDTIGWDCTHELIEDTKWYNEQRDEWCFFKNEFELYGGDTLVSDGYLCNLSGTYEDLHYMKLELSDKIYNSIIN